MKSKILIFLWLLLGTTQAFAHYFWIETANAGKLNMEHKVKIRFGEYTYGITEKVEGEAFKNVGGFSLWLIAPDGKKTLLTTSPAKDYYLASFTPSQKGTYTLALDNKNIKVLDYTKYDFGIFKPQYHCKSKVVVGTEMHPTKTTNPKGIEITDLSKKPTGIGSEVKLKVLFKNKPLPENEVKIFVNDLWSKEMETAEDGTVNFKLPWNTTYTVEVTYSEKTPGNFEGMDYEFIWHCATYYIPPQ